MLLGDRDLAARAAIDVAFDCQPMLTQPATGVFTVTAQPFGPDEAVPTRHQRTHPLEVVASVANGELAITWHHSPACYGAETIERLAATFVIELTALLDLSRTASDGLPSPSDFPLARVDQDQLNSLMRLL
jgi:non-ribosomal peptide synthase protein (TIGR01720 family)